MAPSMKVSGKMTSSMGKVKLTGPIAAATSATTMKADVMALELINGATKMSIVGNGKTMQ